MEDTDIIESNIEVDELDEVKPSDMFTEAKIAFTRSLKEATGYPYELTEEQVIRIVYFFGARRLDGKATTLRKKVENLSRGELMALDKIWSWFNVYPKDLPERKAAFRMLASNFKVILDFLKKRPAFVTTNLHNALKDAGFGSVTSSLVLVVDKDGNKKMRLATVGEVKEKVPIGKVDQMLWEIQGTSLDKIKLIIDSISIKDIEKSNLGMKSKALRDIFSMYHMSRLQNKNPNLTLINMNVNSAEPKEKLQSYAQYLNKNRES